MSFRSLIRESIGSFSRRSFDSYYYFRSRSSSCGSSSVVVSDSPNLKDDMVAQQQQLLQQGRWANMPPELLRDVIQRLETSESAWPNRKNVVSVAAVCRSWRKITMDLVKCPEYSGKLTFPRSLKQFGPRDPPVQCYIKRDRATSTYRLYLGMSPTLMENGKFLLAAKKIRRATSTDYIISLDVDDQSRGSNSYAGKLRSNFLGTKFTIYDSQAPHSGAIASTSRAGRRVASKQVSPRIPAGSYSIANIVYELNVLGTRGPRRMQCTLHTIPASKIGSSTCSGSASSYSVEDESSSNLIPVSVPKNGSGVVPSSSSSSSSLPVASKDGPLVLKNKAPRWHEQLQCWCLNFKGRVTVASVKNFQLVAAPTGERPPNAELDKVILQFGKIGKDMFTMDFRHPLSAFQAFAICLSSFDTKLACE